MTQRMPKEFIVLLAAGLVALLVAGCATAPPPANVKAVDCAARKITWDVAPEAEIVDFSCELGKQAIDPALIFNVALKNVTSKPLRFRINIFLEDMDKAAGHLVPRKGKPPVVAPGAVSKAKIPFIKTAVMSKNITVIVKPLS